MTERIQNPHPGVVPGYSYGQTNGNHSPLSDIELQQLKDSVMFTEEDERYLRLAGRVLSDQVEDILDVWYGWMISNPQLRMFFSDPQGRPLGQYMAAVRKRFAQWILDTCNKPYDRTWLDYQYEIGLRHHRAKKNKTDAVNSSEFINFRYMITFIFPIVYTIKPFLANKGHNTEMVEKMYNAWFKSIVMQTALWSFPYVNPEDF